MQSFAKDWDNEQDATYDNWQEHYNVWPLGTQKPLTSKEMYEQCSLPTASCEVSQGRALSVRHHGFSHPSLTASDARGVLAVAEHPPKVALTLEAATDAAFYIARRRTLVMYHATGDRIVALIDVLSPGNKHSQQTLGDLLDKVVAAPQAGYHVLMIDLFPPGRHDPSGLHGVIWEYLTNQPWHAPPDRPLTLACARTPLTASVEPLCVGCTLPAMPLFLTPDHYVYVPLEETYMAAWRGVPQRWRRVIEA